MSGRRWKLGHWDGEQNLELRPVNNGTLMKDLFLFSPIFLAYFLPLFSKTFHTKPYVGGNLREREV